MYLHYILSSVQILHTELPWGTVPVLEVDGHKLGQSRAICRYLGRLFGIAGKDHLESAKCDELIDAFNDFGAGEQPKLILFSTLPTFEVSGVKFLSKSHNQIEFQKLINRMENCDEGERRDEKSRANATHEKGNNSLLPWSV